MHSSSTVLPPISDLFNNSNSTHSMSRSSVLDIANLLSSPATSEGDYHPHQYHHDHQHHSHATTHQRTGTNHRDLKAKRKRASPNQLVVLNRVFNQTYFPSTEIRIALGKQLGMSPRTVQIWFQNKRQALRSRGRHDSPPSSFYLPPISPPRSPSSELCQPNFSLPPLRLIPPYSPHYQQQQNHHQYHQQQQQYSPSMSYPSPNSIDHLPYREY
ncbi:Protein kinase C signaling pathway involved MAPKK protein [Mucor velutinosus]|uniref:Protein kinase C signaling pathway involved MAPKK protein n=1 Tax=Mucor velutinosus TaxID=708070 RepID=A0AAN7I4H5_9FUNG|nr:Protein kinase C signaling pathway involved MAPKK protein [Mucor velutinosus]